MIYTECLMMRFNNDYSEAFLIRHKESTGIDCVITRAGNPCARERVLLVAALTATYSTKGLMQKISEIIKGTLNGKNKQLRPEN